MNGVFIQSTIDKYPLIKYDEKSREKFCVLAGAHIQVIKICIIEVYLLKYYFERHLIYKLRYYRQTNLQSIKYYGILRKYN